MGLVLLLELHEKVIKNIALRKIFEIEMIRGHLNIKLKSLTSKLLTLLENMNLVAITVLIRGDCLDGIPSSDYLVKQGT